VAPSTAEIRGLHGYAHHGLLVACAAAKEFDEALSHGLAARRLFTVKSQQVELLLNLSALCYDVGDFRASLHGFLRVLAERPSVRVYSHALGGAAISASRLGERSSVDSLATCAQRLLQRDKPAHALADMSREFATAYWHLGDRTSSNRFRNQAKERSERGRFFEITHQLDSIDQDELAPTHAPLSSGEAHAFVEELKGEDESELWANALSSAPQELSIR
jgi:hypothetical protein